MNNYRNLSIPGQDFRIVGAFKKHLLHGSPEAIPYTGFIPVWNWDKEVPRIIDYECTNVSCFVLPVAGPVSLRSILNSIRRDKPVPVYEFTQFDGTPGAKPIGSLTEADLVKVLKNLSLLVLPTEDPGKWKHENTGERFIVLKSEQLGAAGRFGKVPLRELLSLAVGRILKTGEVDYKLDHQILHEHRLPADDVNAIYEAASNVHKNLTSERNKMVRNSLKQSLVQMLDLYCANRHIDTQAW